MMSPQTRAGGFNQPSTELSRDHQEDEEAEAAAGGAALTTVARRRERMVRTRPWR